MADQWKGNKFELSTFLSWGKQIVIGYKTKDENSKTYVVFIWCKCCARNKSHEANHETNPIKSQGQCLHLSSCIYQRHKHHRKISSKFPFFSTVSTPCFLLLM